MINTVNDIYSSIRKANDKLESYFAKADAAGVADLYTPQAMLLPTGSEVVQGRDAIQNFWQGAMNMGIAEVHLRTLEVEEQGDTAVEMGNYVLNGANGSPIDQGKYIVVWKHQGGSWKLHKDIWNSSLPPIH